MTILIELHAFIFPLTFTPYTLTGHLPLPPKQPTGE